MGKTSTFQRVSGSGGGGGGSSSEFMTLADIGSSQPGVDKKAGIRVPRAQLTAASAYDLTALANGETIEKKIIPGHIELSTGDGPGTLNDCLIRYGQPPTWPTTGSANDYHGAKIFGGHSGLTMNYCELEPPPNYRGHDMYGIQGGDFEFNYGIIHPGVVDCFVPQGFNPGAMRTAKIRGSIVSVSWYPDDPRQGPEGAHSDCIQSQGNLENVEILGNTLFGGRTSVLLAQTGVAGGYDGFKFNDNWCYGNPWDGSTINFAVWPDGSNPVSGVEILRNKISELGNIPFGSGAILVTTEVRDLGDTNLGLDGGGRGSPTVDANVYMGTSTAYPIQDQ